MNPDIAHKINPEDSMIEVTIDKEGTVNIPLDEEVKVTNCMSFQNTGSTDVRWSTKEFADDNLGHKVNPGTTVIFEDIKEIYFKNNQFANQTVQVRSE